jgi:hypothetical protein
MDALQKVTDSISFGVSRAAAYWLLAIEAG